MRTFDPTFVPQVGSEIAGPRRQADAADARTRQRASTRKCVTLARSTGTLFLLAALGVSAHADGGMTRAQVKADLAEAMRTGEMLAPGESGLTLRELNPQRYSSPVVEIGRAHV